MNPLHRLILSGTVALAGFAVLAPAIAADTTPAPTRSRACHWDRTTGRMICTRVRTPKPEVPPPAPAPQEPAKP